MKVTTLTTSELLTQEERNWTIDEYLECDQEVHNGYFDEAATKVWLESLSDDELVEEALALMPDYLDLLEATYETQLASTYVDM